MNNIDLTKIKEVKTTDCTRTLQEYLEEGWVIITTEPKVSYDDSNQPFQNGVIYHVGKE